MAIGTLTVNVAAKTNSAVTNLKRVKTEAKSTGGAFRQMGRAMFSIRGAVASLAGIAGIAVSFRGFRSLAEDLDEVAKTASKLDIATEKLSGLHFAAEQSGESAETLNKSLEKMVRNISEAATGTGEAVDTLEMLGVNAERLNRLKPDEQLEAIAAGMGRLELHSDKVRASIELFGRSGAGMVNILKDGVPGLRAFIKEAEGLGKTFSKEQLAGVEAYNDSWNRLKTALGALGQNIVVGLAGDLTKLNDSITKFIVSGEALESLREFADGLRDVKDLVADLASGFNSVAGALRKIAADNARVSGGTLTPGGRAFIESMERRSNIEEEGFWRSTFGVDDQRTAMERRTTALQLEFARQRAEQNQANTVPMAVIPQ